MPTNNQIIDLENQIENLNNQISELEAEYLNDTGNRKKEMDNVFKSVANAIIRANIQRGHGYKYRIQVKRVPNGKNV